MPSNSTFSRAGRSPLSRWVVVIVPLATYCSAWPSASITPKPVVWRPGSIPRMRIVAPILDANAGFDAEIPAHGMKEDRRGEAQGVDPIEQPVGAGHRHRLLAPGSDPAIALQRLHHQ